jgi:hypothetical protein
MTPIRSSTNAVIPTLGPLARECTNRNPALGMPMHRGPKARPHTSLGRRPRYRETTNHRGLKARHITTHQSHTYRSSNTI